MFISISCRILFEYTLFTRGKLIMCRNAADFESSMMNIILFERTIQISLRACMIKHESGFNVAASRNKQQHRPLQLLPLYILWSGYMLMVNPGLGAGSRSTGLATAETGPKGTVELAARTTTTGRRVAGVGPRNSSAATAGQLQGWPCGLLCRVSCGTCRRQARKRLRIGVQIIPNANS